MNEIKEYEEIIENLKKIRRRDTRIKIILIIIIIILLLLLFLGWRIGKIGYGENNAAIPTDGNITGMQIIKVFQGDLEITKDTDLNIFKNEKFNGEQIIAPFSVGSYKFCVKNEANENIKYDIKFTDKMDIFVNMKYKLKIDNIYIRGSENSYVTIDELSVENITVPKDSNNTFTLEWEWEDANDFADTLAATQNEEKYYTLNLGIFAKPYNDEE